MPLNVPQLTAVSAAVGRPDFQRRSAGVPGQAGGADETVRGVILADGGTVEKVDHRERVRVGAGPQPEDVRAGISRVLEGNVGSTDAGSTPTAHSPATLWFASAETPPPGNI